MVQGVGQAVVTHVSGQDDFLLARGSGDGAGAGVVLTGSGAVVAGGVVAELRLRFPRNRGGIDYKE